MATEGRTVSGKFYGIEPPSALVKRDDNNKIMRVAFQKVVLGLYGLARETILQHVKAFDTVSIHLHRQS
jgi:hypothetical protein